MFLCIKKPSFYDSLDLEIGISRAPKEVEGISFLPSLSFSKFPLKLFLFLVFCLFSFFFFSSKCHSCFCFIAFQIRAFLKIQRYGYKLEIGKTKPGSSYPGLKAGGHLYFPRA